MNIVFILFLLVVIYFFYAHLETFSVFPSNAFKVPDNPITTVYEAETNKLNSLFASKNVLTSTPPNQNTYPSFYQFPFSESFKTFVGTFINNVLLSDPEYAKTKFTILRDLTNISWHDENNWRIFSFNLFINNPTKSLARELVVVVKLSNINKYVLSDNTYNPLISKVDDADISVLFVKTADPLAFMQIPPSEEINSEYYQINNTLHLLDPFLTSGKNMQITQQMKDNFNTVVQDKLQMSKSNKIAGFCFNSTNASATDDLQCAQSGGVWDYPPNHDTDCPFYMANANYPNTFGNIKGNVCQLPQNMQLLGYTKYSNDPQYVPLCYNCKTKQINSGTLGYCCNEQHNKADYPTLISPDYAFGGDAKIRQQNSNAFANKNLSII